LQSPGSRRGVAPCRLGATPAAPFSPALPRGCHRPSGPGCAPPLRPLGIRARPPQRGSPPCLRGRPDDRCAATGPPLRHFVLFFCPVPADFASLRLPVLGRCGRLRDRINPRTLRSAAFVWCSGPSADRRFALTALALRFIQPLARSRCDLASLGRTGSRADAQSAPRPHEDADAPLSCAVVARLPPVTSFVGDRRPRAIRFFSVAVTRPPLRSGRDTSPWFAPSPSKPLRGFQGAGRSRPAVGSVRSGAPKTQAKRSNLWSGGNNDAPGLSADVVARCVQRVSAFRLFPRSRCFLSDSETP